MHPEAVEFLTQLAIAKAAVKNADNLAQLKLAVVGFLDLVERTVTKAEHEVQKTDGV